MQAAKAGSSRTSGSAADSSGLPAHAQALYELAATPVKPVIVPKRIRKALSLPDPLGAGDIGSPVIHGIGATEEDDIVRPLSSLGGGTLIVGTTQAGRA